MKKILLLTILTCFTLFHLTDGKFKKQTFDFVRNIAKNVPDMILIDFFPLITKKYPLSFPLNQLYLLALLYVFSFQRQLIFVIFYFQTIIVTKLKFITYVIVTN
jgi:hypothetical protein